MDHFARRTVFRRFDRRCLRDYVLHATEPDPQGVHLRFDPDIESRIYRTLPHDLVRSAARLAVPGGVIFGAASEIARRAGSGTSRRYLMVAATPGGHLFPLQNPEAAAHAVLRMIGDLGLR